MHCNFFEVIQYNKIERDFCMILGLILGFIAGFTFRIVETEEFEDYDAEEPFSSVFDEEY